LIIDSNTIMKLGSRTQTRSTFHDPQRGSFRRVIEGRLVRLWKRRADDRHADGARLVEVQRSGSGGWKTGDSNTNSS
jgi:hypothetical protein